MKMNLKIAAAVLIALVSTQSALAKRPTGKQVGELFVEGTITDGDKVWNVIVVPGTANITRNAKEGFVEAGKDLQEFASKKFWKRRGKNVKDGLKFSKDVVVDHWLIGIKEDFVQTRKENATVAPGEMGSFFSPLANWLKFSFMAAGRTIWMPIGVTGGVAYSVVVPTTAIVSKPIVEAALLDTALVGITVPTVLYVWNGVAWAGSSIGKVPTQSSTFVHLTSASSKPGSQVKIDLVIDQTGFETIVQAAVLKTLTDAEIKQLRARVAELEKKIQEVTAPLKAEVGELSSKEEKVANDFRASTAEQVRAELFAKARAAASVQLSEQAKDLYLDESSLRNLIDGYLKAAGVENASPETIEEIAKLVTKTLENMSVKMAEKAAEAQKTIP